MNRKRNRILTVLIVLFCVALLAGAGILLAQVLPEKAPGEVTSLETGSVFEQETAAVAPDREEAYEGDLPPAAEVQPEQNAPQDEPSSSDTQDPAEETPSDAAISDSAAQLAQKTLASMTQDEKIWQLFYVTPELLTGVETATRAGPPKAGGPP